MLDDIVAVGALARIGGPAVEPLLAALASPDGNVQTGAAAALGEIGDRRAVEPLIAVLHGPGVGESVQDAAARALGKLGDPRAMETLLAVLHDGQSAQARKSAAESLGRLAEPRATEPLLAAHSDVGRPALAALVQIGAPAVEPLIAALHDARTDVRLTAVRALRSIGDPRAAEPLVSAIADESAAVAEAAAKAVDHIGAPAPQPRVLDQLSQTGALAALASDEPQARRQAITVLLSSGFEDPADTRSVAILGRSPGVACSQEQLNQDIERFPDFDIAYVRAAYPTTLAGDHGHADLSRLPEGLARCKVRGRILARLSSYSVWNGDCLKALDCAVAAVLFGDPSAAPGDMVQVAVLLSSAFAGAGLHGDARLAIKVNDRYELGLDEEAAVKRAAATLASQHAEDVRWAAQTVRTKLRRALHR